LTVRDWLDQAREHVIVAREHARFTGEECIATATIPPPPDARAWGNPFRAAAKAGAIERAGFVIHKRRGSPTPLWKSRLI
jgi:hypothetical protein